MLPEDHPVGEGDQPSSSRPLRTDLAAVKAFMEAHYHEPLTIGQLALAAGISPKYFVDLFKKTYGQSAMDYLTDLRINRAKRYLSETGERLKDIAQKVGYSDEFYFSRKFKKEVGVSPSAFVKNPKQRIAACSPSVTGQLLALHVIPAAAPLDSKWTAYYYNSYRAHIKVHLELSDPYTQHSFEANLDRLARARPDAIIAADDPAAQSVRKRLADIAPSLFVPSGTEGWREELKTIARFIGKEDKAGQWIDGYEKRVQSARKEIGSVLGDDSILVLRIYKQGLHIYWNRGLEDVLFRDLLLRRAHPEQPAGSMPLSLEQLAALNPDRIMLVVCPEASSRAFWLALQHFKAWRQLAAVQNGLVYPIPSDPWFEYSAVAISRMLDEALLLFTGKCPNSLQDCVHGGSYGT